MSRAQEIYEAVEALRAETPDLDKQAAFEFVAEREGIKPSNVSGNYYRHAKKIGAPVQPRVRRARSGPKAKAVALNPEPHYDYPPAIADAINAIVLAFATLQAERDAQATLIEEMRRLAG